MRTFDGRRYCPDRLGPLAEKLIEHNQRILARREQRIAAYQAKIDRRLGRVGKPKSHRGARRRVVILSMAGPDGGCPVFNSVTDAAVVVGVVDTTLCGAIRRKGRANGHHCDYLDQIESMGELRDGRFFPRPIAHNELPTFKGLTQ